MADEIILDENNQNVPYEDWLWGCKDQDNIASNGQWVTVALALQIAADVMRGLDPDTPAVQIWTPRDMKLARAAIAGLRAQHGVEEYTDGPMIHLTHYCDIAIYG